MFIAKIYMNLAYSLSDYTWNWYNSLMRKFLISLFILNMQILFVVAQEIKPLENYLTKKILI